MAAGKRSWSRILLRGIGVPLGVVLIGAVSVWWNHHNAAKEFDKYAVGDCLVLTKDGLGVEDTEAECTEDPSYTVASRVEPDAACPSDSYATFDATYGGDSVARLCLIENLAAGHCYEAEFLSDLPQLVECTGRSSISDTFKVLSREDTADGSCAADTTAISYPVPAPGRTYCLGPAS